MYNQELFDNTVAMLKVCIFSKLDGILVEDINDEYFKFENQYIPYLKLGFPSVYEFLNNVSDIKITTNENGKHLVKLRELESFLLPVPTNTAWNYEDSNRYICPTSEQYWGNYFNLVLSSHEQRNLTDTVRKPISNRNCIIDGESSLKLAILEPPNKSLWKKAGQTIRDCIDNLYKIHTIPSRIFLILSTLWTFIRERILQKG